MAPKGEVAVGGVGGVPTFASCASRLTDCGRPYPLVDTLNLYDIANVAGVAADLSHVNTGVAVFGYTGPEQLGAVGL
jgi:malate/lactate dehydrogenase